jgi:Fe2+ transport system protein B
VLFVLYFAGIASAMAVAWVIKLASGRKLHHPLMMELPSYRWPNLRNLLLGLYERAKIFLARVGGIILSLTILLWFLSSYPAPPADAAGPAIQYSLAGILGRGLETVLAPIGFNWQISIALIPGLAAREVAVGALGTVYALSAAGDDDRRKLVACNRVCTACVVCICTPVHFDARHREARNQFAALPAADGRLPVRACLCGGLCHLPVDPDAYMRMMECKR